GVIRETLSRLQINKTNGVYKAIDGDLNKLEAKHVFDEAKKGDEFALSIVDYVAEYLSMGIGNVLNIINPDVIILSGGVALAGDILLDKVKEKLPNYALAITIENLKIKLGELGNDAGIKGASALTI
ncbi:MAG: ROK family protein, partial [Cetobacterium sp.]